MKIEICANSIQSALAAQKAGADRIELCSALTLGGITPSKGLISEVKKAVDIPVHVLIRPRPGGFQYSKTEIAVMIADIEMCDVMGCEGIVIGALDDDNNIDMEAMLPLISAAQDMDITFHRAFDMLAHPERELQILKKMPSLGVKRVLTSGQKNKAIDGIKLLKELKKIAGKKIEIMPGSGISLDTIPVFKKAGFTSVHLSASGTTSVEASSLTEVHFGVSEPIANEAMIKSIVALAKK